MRLPIEAVARRAREAGILTVVDGAHAVGQWPVDLGAIGVDLYASNFHKWLCAPKGSGFLYAHPDQQGWLESPIVSWGWVEGSDRHRPQSQFVSRNQIQGTRDMAAFLSAPAAVAYQEARDWETVRERCHALAAEARDADRRAGRPTADRAGRKSRWVSLVSPDGRRAPAGGIDGKALKRRLYDEYRVEAPVTWWDEKPFIRVSFQGYNTRDDLEALISALEHLLPEMTPA